MSRLLGRPLGRQGARSSHSRRTSAVDRGRHKSAARAATLAPALTSRGRSVLGCGLVVDGEQRQAPQLAELVERDRDRVRRVRSADRDLAVLVALERRLERRLLAVRAQRAEDQDVLLELARRRARRRGRAWPRRRSRRRSPARPSPTWRRGPTRRRRRAGRSRRSAARARCRPACRGRRPTRARPPPRAPCATRRRATAPCRRTAAGRGRRAPRRRRARLDVPTRS